MCAMHYALCSTHYTLVRTPHHIMPYHYIPRHMMRAHVSHSYLRVRRLLHDPVPTCSNVPLATSGTTGLVLVALLPTLLLAHVALGAFLIVYLSLSIYRYIYIYISYIYIYIIRLAESLNDSLCRVGSNH